MRSSKFESAAWWKIVLDSEALGRAVNLEIWEYSFKEKVGSLQMYDDWCEC